MRFSIVSVLAIAATAFAAPATIKQRQSSTTCGSNYYSASQVNDAFNQGLNYYYNGEQVGNDDYPHTYNDYEGFDFPVGGPYQEFPIEESSVYTGGMIVLSLKCEVHEVDANFTDRSARCRPGRLQHRWRLCWSYYAHWRLR